MFDISVWPLLNTYAGDSQTLAFNGEILPELWEDLSLRWPLAFELTLIALENGVEAIVRKLQCNAEYEGTSYKIQIPEVSRTFQSTFDPLAPDDVGFIDMKNATIDLGKVLREEIIMACYS